MTRFLSAERGYNRSAVLCVRGHTGGGIASLIARRDVIPSCGCNLCIQIVIDVLGRKEQPWSVKAPCFPSPTEDVIPKLACRSKGKPPQPHQAACPLCSKLCTALNEAMVTTNGFKSSASRLSSRRSLTHEPNRSLLRMCIASSIKALDSQAKW